MELGRRGTADRAIAIASGYWNVYLGFFGDQMLWLHFSVVDLRDGRLVWRNGRQVKEETAHGKTTG